jgi:hypothetical protein
MRRSLRKSLRKSRRSKKKNGQSRRNRRQSVAQKGGHPECNRCIFSNVIRANPLTGLTLGPCDNEVHAVGDPRCNNRICVCNNHYQKAQIQCVDGKVHAYYDSMRINV